MLIYEGRIAHRKRLPDAAPIVSARRVRAVPYLNSIRRKLCVSIIARALTGCIMKFMEPNDLEKFKNHDFSKQETMTPDQFHKHLDNMVTRIRNDQGFDRLSFMNRHQFSALADNFRRMWKKYFSKDAN